MHRILFAALFLTGCGGPSKACLDYADANKACIQDAEDAGLNVDVDTSDAEGFCDEFAETPDETWACLSEAYRKADCTTDEGLGDALVAADACGPLK